MSLLTQKVIIGPPPCARPCAGILAYSIHLYCVASFFKCKGLKMCKLHILPSSDQASYVLSQKWTAVNSSVPGMVSPRASIVQSSADFSESPWSGTCPHWKEPLVCWGQPVLTMCSGILGATITK